MIEAQLRGKLYGQLSNQIWRQLGYQFWKQLEHQPLKQLSNQIRYITCHILVDEIKQTISCELRE